MDAVPIYDIRKCYLVLFQLGFDLAPTGGSYRFQETGQQFLLGSFPETLSAQMFDDRIHVGLIDRSESHRQCLSVNFRDRDIHIVGLVEIGNDAVGKVCVGIVVLVHKVVNEVERFELIVRIIILPVVEIKVTDGDLAVVLVLKLSFFPVLFRILLEDGVPLFYLVECLVQKILL